MDQDNMASELGRRDFIRSAALLGTGLGASALVGACSDAGEQPLASPSSDVVVEGRMWVHTDSFDPALGIFTSLSSFSDTGEGPATSDVEMGGYSILPSGEIVPVTDTIDKDIANSYSMVSVGGGVYHIERGGIPQPEGAPYEIHLVEGAIPGTDIMVNTGYSLDPSTGNRVSFTVTRNRATPSSSAQIRFAMAPGFFVIITLIWMLIIIGINAKPAHGQGAGG